jgi:hypothetical protein
LQLTEKKGVIMSDVIQIAFVVMAIGVGFVLLAIGRALVLWYFGIQKIHDNQAETIRLLKVIANQNSTKHHSP